MQLYTNCIFVLCRINAMPSQFPRDKTKIIQSSTLMVKLDVSYFYHFRKTHRFEWESRNSTRSTVQVCCGGRKSVVHSKVGKARVERKNTSCNRVKVRPLLSQFFFLNYAREMRDGKKALIRKSCSTRQITNCSLFHSHFIHSCSEMCNAARRYAQVHRSRTTHGTIIISTIKQKSWSSND